jgi:hypothetical protein
MLLTWRRGEDIEKANTLREDGANPNSVRKHLDLI